MTAATGARGPRPGGRAVPFRRFLGRLRSWQLFVAAAALLIIDLAVPDPIPMLDEMALAVLTYALARWKKR